MKLNCLFAFKGGLYVIHSIASVDRGIYICTADNLIDPLANLTVQFIVKFAPICVKVKVVSTHNESLRATLDCLVAGNLKCFFSFLLPKHGNVSPWN